MMTSIHIDGANRAPAGAASLASRIRAWRRENTPTLASYALALRLGLGAVFVIGGLSKLNLLLDPAREAFILDLYMGPKGYINAFFAAFLFEAPLGAVVTPWRFLTLLSTWELVSGLLLWTGLFVRPIAFVYGFLLWTFVMALPVVTTPAAAEAFGAATYTAPALLVQIRDVGLSGMMFVLFVLGAGLRSVDGPRPVADPRATWDALGLLLRLSLAAPLIVGGVFAGMATIQSFATPGWLLAGAGILIAAGVGVREAALVAAGIMVWYAATKINLDASPLANLNGFKREIAFFAAALVLVHAGGGRLFTAQAAWRALKLRRNAPVSDGA